LMQTFETLRLDASALAEARSSTFSSSAPPFGLECRHRLVRRDTSTSLTLR
jgi:hypothetical protein